jgi:hypothetical protein
MSQSGTVQRVASLGDHWTARVSLLVTPANRIKWSSFVAGRRGSLRTTTLGPVLEPVFPSTGATTQGTTLAGASSITINVASAAAVPDECFFGIASRLYLATSKTTDSATRVTMSFWPPLRADVAAGTALDTDPECTVYISNPEMMTATIGDVSDITVELREAF